MTRSRAACAEGTSDSGALRRRFYVCGPYRVYARADPPSPASTSSTCGARSFPATATPSIAYPRALCCSFHTTAGYLDQSVAARLNQSPAGVMPYIDSSGRSSRKGPDTSTTRSSGGRSCRPAQRPSEPRNADSHLAFMAGALRTCVAYLNRPGEPMSFIDLDGVHAGRPRDAAYERPGVFGGGDGRAGARGGAGVGAQGRVDQPEGPAPRRLRAVRRARHAARRHEGAHPALARRRASGTPG